MLISKSFVAEMLGKEQAIENVFIDVFEFCHKNKIKNENQLLIHLKNKEITVYRSVELCLDELLRLKLIESGHQKDIDEVEETQRLQEKEEDRKTKILTFDVTL